MLSECVGEQADPIKMRKMMLGEGLSNSHIELKLQSVKQGQVETEMFNAMKACTDCITPKVGRD